MTREEFLRRRKSGIGGSDVAAIMGLSKYRSPLDVWRDKTSEEINTESSDILELASYLEEYTAQKYAERTGHKVRRKFIELVHSEYPFLRGNIDREILLDDRGVGVLECKALSTFNFRRVKAYGLPDDYLCQIQHYFLTGNGRYTWGAFAILNRDTGELLDFEISPDANVMSGIEAICVPFWRNNVEKRTAPDWGESAAERAVSLPKFEGEIADRSEDQNLASLLRQRSENKVLMDEAKSLLEQTDALIAEAMGETEAAECAGYRVYYRSSSRTSLDTAAIKKELPDVFKKYSKTTVTARSLRFYAVEK